MKRKSIIVLFILILIFLIVLLAKLYYKTNLNNNAEITLYEEAYLESKKNNMSFMWPIDDTVTRSIFFNEMYIYRKFGIRKHPFFNKFNYYNYISISVSSVRRVQAVFTGEVIFVGVQNGQNCIIIRNYNFVVIYYNVLNYYNLVKGSKVEGGEIIGVVGNASACINLEMKYKNKTIDPILFLFAE